MKVELEFKEQIPELISDGHLQFEIQRLIVKTHTIGYIRNMSGEWCFTPSTSMIFGMDELIIIAQFIAELEGRE